jgi:hypothetical protein
MAALFARWYCARVVFREMRLGAHSASWEWCRAHRGGVAVELAPATAGARAEGDVFFDVATVVKEVEAGAANALDGVGTGEGDYHR